MKPESIKLKRCVFMVTTGSLMRDEARKYIYQPE